MRTRVILLCTTLASPALADTPAVVTGTPVVQSLVAQVMGDLGTPDVLLDRGGDPHSFQLRPAQAQALEQADLVFWVGPELTPWLQRAIDGVEARGEVIGLLDAQGVFRQDFIHGHSHDHDHGHDDHGHDDLDHDHGHDDHGHDDHDHDHGHDDHGHDDHDHDHGHDDHGHDDHDHDHGHDDHGHDHAHDGVDPHAWLHPDNARVWIDVIADELSRHDPDNAETYAANAQSAKADIDEIEAQVRTTLEPVGDAPIIVFHDAYGYLDTAFGVNVAGTIALGDAASPGAQRLAELRAMLDERGVVCIFPEVNHSSAYVDVVVENTGVRIGEELDPAGVLLEYGPGQYGALMTGLAESIAACVTEG